MCDFKIDYKIDKDNHKKYKCTQVGDSICIFHDQNEEKDADLFYQEFLKLYKSGLHEFVAFKFPKSFDFDKLNKEVGGLVFNNATFFGATFLGDTDFSYAEFNGNRITDFRIAKFSGEGKIDFSNAKFRSKNGTTFMGAKFSNNGGVTFIDAEFTGDEITDFKSTEFKGDGTIYFNKTKFKSEGGISFTGAYFSNKGGVDFENTIFTGDGITELESIEFRGEGTIDFTETKFRSKGGTTFRGTHFSNNGKVVFFDTVFSGGEKVKFTFAEFSGEGEVLFYGPTFYNYIEVDFISVTFRYPERITFADIDFSRAMFRWTDISRVNFHEIIWHNNDSEIKHLRKSKMLYDEIPLMGNVQRLLRRGLFTKLRLYKAENEGKDDKYRYLKKWNLVKPEPVEDGHYNLFFSYSNLLQNYERSGRYHEAGDFFIGAMEMRRTGTFEKFHIRAILHLYKLFSLYGERPLRPLFCIIALPLVFALLYLLLSGIEIGVMDINYDLVFSLKSFGKEFFSHFSDALVYSLSVMTLGKF